MDIKQLFKKMKNEKPTTKAFLFKDAEDKWWFFGIYSNKFKDFVGDILTKDSHEEYIQWLKDTGFKPVITVHHMPKAPRYFWPLVFDKYENDVKTLQRIVDSYYSGFSFAKAERVVYANGFVAVVAKVLEGREHVAERLSLIPDLGMSHGFIDKDSDVNIFNKYRTFEMSTLRSVRAANPFTLSQVIQKGLAAMSGNTNEKGLKPEDRSFLVDVFGEELITKFEARTEVAESILSKVLEYKDDIMGDDQKTEVIETPVEEAAEVTELANSDQTTEETKENAPTGLTLEVVAKETANAFTQLHMVLTQMQKQLEAVASDNAELRKELTVSKDALSNLQKSEDDKIAAQWLPAYNWTAGYSPSMAKDNVLESVVEKEALTVNAPTGSAPQGVDTDNPLHLGFWSQLPALMEGK